MDDLLRINRIKSRRAVAVPGQIGVTLVLENGHAMLTGQGEQRLTSLQRQDRSGRVLDRRDRIDVFRDNALAPKILDDPSKCVDLQPLLVERGADDVHPEALQLGKRTAIGKLFEDHRVATLE